MADQLSVRARVADWVVEYRATHVELLDAFQQVLGPAPRARTDHGRANLVIEAFLPGDASYRGETPDPQWVAVDKNGPMTLWHFTSEQRPPGVGLTSGRSMAKIESAAAAFHFPDVREARGVLHTFVTAAITHLARLNNVVPCHSALIEVDGEWLLLIGPSGIGKSTSCLAASIAGHRIASDDTCLLRMGDGAVSGHGFPRAPSLPKVGHGIAVDRPVDHRQRTSEPEFPLVAGWHRLSGVLILRHGNASQSLLGAAAAVDVIQGAANSIVGALTSTLVVDAAPGILQALSRLPARSLALGADAASRLESTAAALSLAAAEVRPDR